jgi:hypothetical protein
MTFHLFHIGEVITVLQIMSVSTRFTIARTTAGV